VLCGVLSDGLWVCHPVRMQGRLCTVRVINVPVQTTTIGLTQSPIQCTKEPFRGVVCCTIEKTCLACGGIHDPQHSMKGCQGPAVPPGWRASCSMAAHAVQGAIHSLSSSARWCDSTGRLHGNACGRHRGVWGVDRAPRQAVVVSVMAPCVRCASAWSRPARTPSPLACSGPHGPGITGAVLWRVCV
jgi:hypothetical protein